MMETENETLTKLVNQILGKQNEEEILYQPASVTEEDFPELLQRKIFQVEPSLIESDLLMKITNYFFAHIHCELSNRLQKHLPPSIANCILKVINEKYEIS